MGGLIAFLIIVAVSAGTGWAAQRLVVAMVFRPADFKGKPPALGWQGIVPRRAGRIAGILAETITRELVDLRDLFAPIDPAAVTSDLQEPLARAIDRAVPEIMQAYQSECWNSLPPPVQGLIVGRVKQLAPGMVFGVLEHARRDPDSVLDVTNTVADNFTRERAALAEVFRAPARNQFAQLSRSGLFVGAAAGVVIGLVWLRLGSAAVTGVLLVAVGAGAALLAVRMLFAPHIPMRYFGFYDWLALFVRRRPEIAAGLATLLGDQLLTPRRLLDALVAGPLSDRVYRLVLEQTQEVLNKNVGRAKPLAVHAVGSSTYQEMKRMLSEGLAAELPGAPPSFADYGERAEKITAQVGERVAGLSDEQFEALVRPAFDDHQRVLIAAGGVVGLIAALVTAVALAVVG